MYPLVIVGVELKRCCGLYRLWLVLQKLKKYRGALRAQTRASTSPQPYLPPQISEQPSAHPSWRGLSILCFTTLTWVARSNIYHRVQKLPTVRQAPRYPPEERTCLARRHLPLKAYWQVPGGVEEISGADGHHEIAWQIIAPHPEVRQVEELQQDRGLTCFGNRLREHQSSQQRS